MVSLWVENNECVLQIVVSQRVYESLVRKIHILSLFISETDLFYLAPIQSCVALNLNLTISPFLFFMLFNLFFRGGGGG